MNDSRLICLIAILLLTPAAAIALFGWWTDSFDKVLPPVILGEDALFGFCLGSLYSLCWVLALANKHIR